MFWTRVRDYFTRDALYEYESVFTDVDEAVEDVQYMVNEGRIPVVSGTFEVELYDTHPDVPGSRLVGRRRLRFDEDGA